MSFWAGQGGPMDLSRDVVGGVIREVNEQSGTVWVLTGRLPGGSQSGAWGVVTADGVAGVLKIATTPEWARQVVRAERAIATVRQAGYPTPAWLAVGTTTAGFGFQIQEKVTGAPIEVVSLHQAEAFVAVLERQNGVDPDPERCWNDFLADQLTSGWRRMRATVSATGPLGHELVDRCDLLLHDVESFTAPRTDMVHGDFRPANILFDHDQGRVSGVVDIEAIGSGTRAFDYATLLSHSEIEPDAVDLLAHAGAEAAGRGILHACFAQVALDLVRFIDQRTSLTGEERLGNLRALIDRAEHLAAM